MSNVYVTRMKNALNEYYNKELALADQLADVNRKYSSVYAEQESNKIKRQSEDVYAHYKNRIVKIYEEVRELLSVASYPDTQRLTRDKELFMLNSPFRLSPAEVAIKVGEFQKAENYGMLRMVKDWISQHDLPAENGMNPYADIRIDLPIDLLAVYRKFANSALSQMEAIHRNAKTVNPAAVTWYADENFGASLFAVIGTGINLGDYKNVQVNEQARHLFDDVTLSI